MNLQEFYKEAGGNASEMIARLGGNEEIIKKFLVKFLSDNSFTELERSLDSSDTQTAFRMAHTLKGVAANLGLETLFTHASSVTEFLRFNKYTSAKNAMPELSTEYSHVIKLIKNLAGDV